VWVATSQAFRAAHSGMLANQMATAVAHRMNNGERLTRGWEASTKRSNGDRSPPSTRASAAGRCSSAMLIGGSLCERSAGARPAAV